MSERTWIRIEFGKRDLPGEQIEATVTLRGSPASVIESLITGLPQPAVKKIVAALDAELRRRARRATRRRTKS